MKRRSIIFAHSWTDVSVNIQTKNAALKLSEQADVCYLTQARVGRPVLKVNEHLTVMEWPNKRPTTFKDLFFCIKQIRAVKADTIIVHFGATKITLLASWLTGVKNRIAWYHTLSGQMRIESGSSFKGAYNIFQRRISYWMATKVVTLNKFAALDAVNNQHIAQHKIVTIANGMDIPVGRKAHYGYEAENINFLYLGRLTGSKGCAFIIKVFAQLVQKHANISLRLVGTGDEEDALKKLVVELGVTQQIVFEGAKRNYNDVFGYIHDAYAMVVPSRIDNFPTVIIEAFACGVPVIASEVGGIPEMIEDGKDGFLCELENSRQWIEKIEWLINNPASRNEMAAQARNSYEAKFNIGRHVEKVVDFVSNLRG